MDLSGLRETLFGSRLRIVAVALLVVGGGLAAAYLVGIIGAPAVTGVDNAFGNVNQSTTVIESDLQVRNPNPVGASLGGLTVDYVAEMNGIEMATGTKNGVSVETGTSTVPFRTAMDNEKIPPWWTSHIRNGEHTDLTISADVHSSLVGASFDAPQVERDIDTDLISAFNSSETRPLNANQEPVVSDPVMYLNSTSGSWGNVSSERTEIDMKFVVYNPKSYPITISTIGYNISMNGVDVGSGQTAQTYTIPPGETETIEATTTIRNGNLDEWWVSHLQRNQVTELRISMYMEFDLSAGPTQLTNVRIPLEDLTRTVETDIFGNKDGTGSESGDADDGLVGGSDGDSTETETETPTETPTETDTATETPTSTPTDDGGLL